MISSTVTMGLVLFALIPLLLINLIILIIIAATESTVNDVTATEVLHPVYFATGGGPPSPFFTQRSMTDSHFSNDFLNILDKIKDAYNKFNLPYDPMQTTDYDNHQ
ncbi:uncharacterized protein LOC143032895 [Oratosquilla oratoria]|uniref:uncharacterized protein LOC143032895 n=1 Tax=Oratosquilla oratoria TaxID=337810 RepID=UPI003F7759D2